MYANLNIPLYVFPVICIQNNSLHGIITAFVEQKMMKVSQLFR